MNGSSESAEMVVRMYLEGVQVAVKVTGSGAKNVVALLYAALNGKNKTRGKTSLAKMLKSGKELKVFSINKEDLKMFTREAKKYGVLFNVILDKKNIGKDGLVDIMVRAEDAAKINRIVEKFKLTTVDIAKVKKDIQQDKENKNSKSEKNETVNKETKLADEIVKEDKEINPNSAMAEKSPLSEPSSKHKSNLGVDSNSSKKSVRKELNDIKKELNNKKINTNSKNLEKKSKKIGGKNNEKTI